MNKREELKQYKALKDYSGVFDEELDKELKKIPTLKEKLIYLYQLKRQNENDNVLAGGFYYHGMVILNRLKYYDTALQYSKSQKNSDAKSGEKKTDPSPKIIWKKSKEDLIALIDKLIDLDFIGYEKDKDNLISEHFGWTFELPKQEAKADHTQTNKNYRIIKSKNTDLNSGGIRTFLEAFEKKRDKKL